MGVSKLLMDQHGTKNETNMEAHGRPQEIHGDIIVIQ